MLHFIEKKISPIHVTIHILLGTLERDMLFFVRRTLIVQSCFEGDDPASVRVILASQIPLARRAPHSVFWSFSTMPFGKVNVEGTRSREVYP